MEFQFCSLTIEERYPRAVDTEQSALEELRTENGHRTVKTCTVEKQTPGCVAFLWGRTAEEQSVCVRTEGVRPVLFFEMTADESLRDGPRPGSVASIDANIRLRAALSSDDLRVGSAEPDVLSYTSLAQASVWAGDAARCEGVVLRMLEAGPAGLGVRVASVDVVLVCLFLIMIGRTATPRAFAKSRNCHRMLSRRL